MRGTLGRLSHLSPSVTRAHRQPHEGSPHAHRTARRPAQRARPAGGRRAAGRQPAAPGPAPGRAEFRSQPLRGVAARRRRARRGCGAARGRRSRPSSDGQPAARAAARPAGRAGHPHRACASFDLLGVTWRAGARPADLTVLVRTHGDAGWTGWTALDAADAPAGREGRPPAPAPSRCGSGTPTATRCGSTSARRRCRAACGSTWSTRAARPPTARSGPAGRCSRPRPQPASRRILTRAQWGADESIRGSAPRYNATIKAGFVHHTAGTNGYSAAEVPEDPARHLRVPRQGQRLVRHRLQLPRRPVRPALGGPVRRHRPGRRRRAHRRLQRRHLRGVGDRQLRQGRRAGR